MSSMPTRSLGRTGLAVSVLGLGTEHLDHDRRTAVETIRAAVDAGVNYFDVLMPMPEYRDTMGIAFEGRREWVHLTCHLGGIVTDGQWGSSREPAICEQYVEDWLRRLHTDYVDVLNITVVDRQDDFDGIVAPGGLLDLAVRLKQQGKARFIGMSGHEPGPALAAVSHGGFDVLMQGCHIRWPITDVGKACEAAGIGLVAMKPFGGGEFFYPPFSEWLTPVKALAYVLAQPGVSTVVPGVANVDQLRQALHYLDASETERDFGPLVESLDQRMMGTCVYCNHCLPCPSEIPIGDVFFALRGLGWGLGVAPQMAAKLAEVPGRCVECGECLARCPFGVDIIGGMKTAAGAFAAYAKGQS